MEKLFKTVLADLPVGIVLVDNEDRVVFWNQKAEEFIAHVKRPKLAFGINLADLHPPETITALDRMITSIKNGKQFQPKLIDQDGKRFRVHYIGLNVENG